VRRYQLGEVYVVSKDAPSKSCGRAVIRTGS
jgi:hypothetical protein